MLNGASMYSNNCKKVKIIPNITVNNNPKIASFLLPATIAWCAHVTVAPDNNKITVFNKGTSNAFNV